jgi:hypothetical protein
VVPPVLLVPPAAPPRLFAEEAQPSSMRAVVANMSSKASLDTDSLLPEELALSLVFATSNI